MCDSLSGKPEILLKDYFVGLYWEADFINKLIKTQKSSKQVPIHLYGFSG